MVKKIYVPLDNSDHSNTCIELAINLANRYGASIIGSHVYAAKMHDYRFKQMEYTLPEEYQAEQELERQRQIHDSLITMGLRLISDSYLDVLEEKCKESKIPFERKMFDGRTFQPIVEDIRSSDYDLVIMGALGLGAVKQSTLGSVTDRVIRRTNTDTWVVKNLESNGNGSKKEMNQPILVGLDGSPQSFSGLKRAIALAKTFDRKLEAVAVYDPYLHYVMFNSIVGVLSEKASKVFRFKDQEQLHEEIIDTGLAKIYQSHLEVGKKLAKDEEVDMNITLMDGKAFEKILLYADKIKPSLLVIGRLGIHSEDSMDIGSNAENILRYAPRDVFLSSQKFYPPIDLKAAETMTWTEEADSKMKRVPDHVRGIARTAVLRFASERGHSIISTSVVQEVLDIFMPKKKKETMANLAMELAIEQIRSGKGITFVCSQCGHSARDFKPVRCSVCGAEGEKFQKIDKKAVEALGNEEGDIEEETTFDGVKLQWTDEARGLLKNISSGYLRRRTRARIEKVARVQHLPVITKELTIKMIEETTGESKELSDQENPVETPVWTDEAVHRLGKVPEGFMREMTKENIEILAKERKVERIDLSIAEEAIAQMKKVMNSSISEYLKGGEQQEEIRKNQNLNADDTDETDLHG
jgi:nucleotide-binding universal stress UspA family protein